MKKLIKKLTAFSLPVMMFALSPVNAYAADSNHELYLTSENAEITDTGVVFCIDRSQLQEDYTLKVDIFYRDENLDSWYISPKVKCADKRIKLCNLLDPKDLLIEFAYAEKNDAGELISGTNSTLASGSEIYNTVNFTCLNASLMNRTAMIPYGERSDSYALTSFDAVISKDITMGDYDIYFLTEHEDEPDQRTTEISLMIDGGPEPCDATLTNMKIIVTNMGDIDDNGLIDANDASAILKEYSLISTEKDSSFNTAQSKSADVNGDGFVNSSDASTILRYYAYVSTNGKLSMSDYVKSLEDKEEPPVEAPEKTVTTTDEEIMAVTTQTTTVTTEATTITTEETTTTTTEETATTTETTTEETTTTTEAMPTFSGYVKTAGVYVGTQSYLYPDGDYSYIEVKSYSSVYNRMFDNGTFYKGEDEIPLNLEAGGGLPTGYKLYVTPYNENGTAGETVTLDVPTELSNVTSAWKSFYKEVANEFFADFQSYSRFALVYIDDDDIPELWVKNSITDACSLWTYKNGKGYDIHTGEGPRNGYISGYYPKHNYFATRFFSSINFYATNVRKINDDGTNTIVSQLLYQDNTYKHNGNTVSESQFNEYMKWVDDYFVYPDFVTYSAILDELK